MNAPLLLQVYLRLRQLRERDGWTRPRLEAYQQGELRNLRQFAYAWSPFYQRFHKGLTDRPLHELPVLTKAHVMEHFDELVTDRSVRLKDVEAHIAGLRGDWLFRGRYRVNATSGTTGRRGIFLSSRQEWQAMLASFARAHEWAGIRIGLRHSMRLASVASTVPWHVSARLAATLDSPWTRALRLDAIQPIADIVQRLNDWQPEMLVMYASMARLLAGEQMAGRLHISPRIVWTSSEVLTEEARRLIRQVWQAEPFDQYAATETGGTAAECEEHRGLHLCEDFTIIEVVDAHDRPVPAGVYGDKILVTVLWSRTQPLIRYQMSDSLRLAAAPCPCGRPFALVDGIQGRTEDILHFPAAKGGEVAVHPNVFHLVIDTVPTSAWQVVQESDGLKVLLSGVRDGFAEDALVESISRALAAQGAVVPRVWIERVTEIPKGPLGKAPLVRSEVPRAQPPPAAPR